METVDVNEALKIARTPKPQSCGECGETLYSPMDKLSIALYGKCSVHFEDGSHKENNLITLSAHI